MERLPYGVFGVRSGRAGSFVRIHAGHDGSEIPRKVRISEMVGLLSAARQPTIIAGGASEG
jgi:hypothetical protein